MSEGDKAMSHGNYAMAIELYSGESKGAGVEGQRAHTALIRAMLRADKIKDADKEAHAWAAADPKNVWAQVAVGEVQWREGDVVSANNTMTSAYSIDPCNAQVHADYAESLRMFGSKASASKQLGLARRLDPIDDDIESAWIRLQPRSVQLAEVTAYLTRSSFLSDAERSSLERWKLNLSQPPVEPCRLTSSTTKATIPYQAIRDGLDSPVIWGLDVSFDGKHRRLEIDTGASGLLLTKAAATALHLEPDERIKSWGVGDEGSVDSYIARVKTIKIGVLVFENCDVTVLNKNPRGMQAQDGLIGGDVFQDFLLTLDFPGRVLKLDPLPEIPNTTASAPTLETGVQNDEPVRDAYVAPSMADWSHVFRSGHDLLLPVHLNGGPPHLFILDTGAQLNLISPQAAREVAKVADGSDIEIFGISGQVNKIYTTGPLSLQFGKLRQPTNGMTAIDTSALGRSTGVEVSGFLGAATLHQLTVSIDYRDDLVNFSFDTKRLTRCVDEVALLDCY